MGPEFFQTRMGQKFYEGTMPRIAYNMEKLIENTSQLIQLMKSEDNLRSNFKDPYISLEIPDSNITIQVKRSSSLQSGNSTTRWLILRRIKWTMILMSS